MSRFRKSGSTSCLSNTALVSASTAINPATGEVFAWHPYQTRGEVSALLDAAVSAFKTWRAVAIEDRAAVLVRIGAILRERRNAFATTMTHEMGKPISQARAEVEKCATLCDCMPNMGQR
jgi:acyl-CoA reductase-like NAD-dependent aldehyde dehydrogenase